MELGGDVSCDQWSGPGPTAGAKRGPFSRALGVFRRQSAMADSGPLPFARIPVGVTLPERLLVLFRYL